MRARVLMALAIMAVLPALLIVAAAGPASAHVLKTVGPYDLLIGFGNEPTYAGAQNSVFLQLTDAKTGAPIVDEGLGDTLKVSVGFGTQAAGGQFARHFDTETGVSVSPGRARPAPARALPSAAPCLAAVSGAVACRRGR